MELLKKTVAISLAVIILLAPAAFVWNYVNSPLVVTVTGYGEINIPATASTLTLSVSDTSPDPAAAINLVKTKVEKTKTLLKNAGTSSEDIFESKITVQPTTALAQTKSGYQAVVSLGARKIPTSALEGLIADLYKNGATVVSQPVISLDEQDELEAQAAQKALDDAHNKAKQLAKTKHKFIKKVIAITQSPTQPSSITQQAETDLTSAGTHKLTKTVTVSYKMW